MSREGASPAVWWASPIGAVSLVIPLTLWLAWHLSDSEYRELYRTPKVLTWNGTSLLVAGLLTFYLGALVAHIGQRRPRVAPLLTLSERQWLVLERSTTILFRLALVGYASWLLSAIRHGLSPSLLVHKLTGASAVDFQTLFVTVPGVTTLTQVGIPFVIISVLLLLHGRGKGLKKRLALIFFITLLRSFLLNERLATIELALPTLVLVATHYARSSNGRARMIAKCAPLIFIPLLIVGFGAFEYTRSWTYYRTHTRESYPEFTVKRLAGYYVTAYNNAEIELDYENYPQRLPYGTVEALWLAPGPSQLHLYTKLGNDPTSPLLDNINPTLLLHGNPEFNSPGGLGQPFLDFGTAGGLLYLLVAGVIMGFIYRGFCEGKHLAVLLYPIASTGLFELARYLYWPEGRVTPALLATFVIAHRLHKVRDVAPSPSLVVAV